MEIQELMDKNLSLQDNLRSIEIEKEEIIKQKEELAKSIEEKEQEINRLKQHNLDLFLRVSQPTNENQPKVEEPQKTKQTWDSFLSTWE